MANKNKCLTPGSCFPISSWAIGGGGALLTGLRMNRTRKLEQLLDKVVGERDNIPLPELFAAAGWTRPGTRCREKCYRARILRRGCLY
mgnify:CR=1 FL=1